MKKETAKEITLVTVVILNENILTGGVFQTFDKAYGIAESFVEHYGVDNESWGPDNDFEEAVIKHTNKYING